MYTIRVRRQHKYTIAGILFFVILIGYSVSIVLDNIKRGSAEFEVTEGGNCNKRQRWAPPGQPVIGILGAPGSGVVWLRFLIEQMTGIYTGSVLHQHPDVFVAEGKKEKVVAVMAHDMRRLDGMQAGIILYRNLKDTIRTEYAMQNGRGAFLEAPLQSYYGRDWLRFVSQKAKDWAEYYQVYLDSGVPILIMGHEELEDPAQLRNQLLRISNFLHVPIKNSMFECVISKSQEFPLRPIKLKTGFQPFSLLPKDMLIKLDKLERKVLTQIQITRDRYKPKVR